MAFNLAKCDFCGDCFSMCKYADYDTTRAAEQMKRLVVGDNPEIVTQCVTCAACNAYCQGHGVRHRRPVQGYALRGVSPGLRAGDPGRGRQLDMKIAYQSPCSSRYAPWIDKPLDELFSLIGVVRVDRRYDRLHAPCCGCPVSPHLGREAGESYKNKNIRDAVDHGGEATVFMCTFCALQMRDEAREAGLEPIFLTNLVRLALGETLTFQAAGAGDGREPVVTAVKIVKGQL